MEIRLRDTGQVVSEREFRQKHYSTSFPSVLTADLLADFKADPVLASPTPQVSQYQSAYRNGVAQDSLGNWVHAWSIRDWTQEEIDEFNANQALALQNAVVSATQARLDTFAQTRNYDSILSACTYSSSAIPKFKTEGQYCVNARDATWATLYQVLAQVQAGELPMPTSFADIESLLPVLEWPAT